VTAAALHATGRSTLGVFIADDSPVVRERLTELLSGLDGVSIVGEAVDVPTAERGIEAARPDVAIVDIRMPGGTGIDVLRHVKKGQPGGPCCIVFTDFGSPQYRKACADAGADFFFEKGTDTRRLADALRMLAARR
jgi:DNA-binding NarL/FixJ family response regulator